METNFLEYEINRYEKELKNLFKQEGKFALIKGDEKIEIFDTNNDALKIGYEKYGLEPFLIKKISSVETILKFTRPLNIAGVFIANHHR